MGRADRDPARDPVFPHPPHPTSSRSLSLTLFAPECYDLQTERDLFPPHLSEMECFDAARFGPSLTFRRVKNRCSTMLDPLSSRCLGLGPFQRARQTFTESDARLIGQVATSPRDVGGGMANITGARR